MVEEEIALFHQYFKCNKHLKNDSNLTLLPSFCMKVGLFEINIYFCSAGKLKKKSQIT